MPMVTVQLGRIGEEDIRDHEDRRGQALYLPTQDTIVVVDELRRNGWHGSRVLWGGPGDRDRQMILTGDDLAFAQTTMDVDPDETPGRWLALWLLRVWQERGSRDADVARVLVVEAHVPGSRRIVLTDDNRGRVFERARVTHFGLPRVLTRLFTLGFLARPPDEPPNEYLLTIPAPMEVTGE